MRIAIPSRRWAAVRRALGWTQEQMWAHFAKRVTITIPVPRTAKRKRGNR